MLRTKFTRVLAALPITLLMLSLGSISKTANASVVDGIGDSLGISPFENWKVIETEHFRITFPDNLEATGKGAAQYLEEAHQLLSDLLLWRPKSKTKVLITDTRDDANGLAAPIAGFGMVLYAVAPENHTSLFYYDNWLRLLCIHEYAHILSSDQTNGIFSVFRSIFGPVLLPNALWPRWIHEGLATYFETRFTQGGRGRSPWWMGLVRAAVEEGVWGTRQFMTLDRLGGSNKDYPSGEGAYFFGYFAMEKLAQSRGAGAIGKFARQSSSQFPFFLNSYLQDTSDTKWRTLWNDFVSEYEKRAKQEIAKTKKEGLTPFSAQNEFTGKIQKPFPQPDYHGIGASDDQTLWVASIAYANRPRELYLYNSTRNSTRHISSSAAGAEFGFIPDTHTLLFTDQNLDGPYRQYSDLFYFDADSNQSGQLTFGARIKDFDIYFESAEKRAGTTPSSGRKGWVVYTFEKDSAVGVAIAALELGKSFRLGTPRLLLPPKFLDRFSTPRITVSKSNPGLKIFYSHHAKDDLAEKIYSIFISREWLETGSAAPALSPQLEFSHDQSQNRYLAVGPNQEILFISNLSGADQLYTLENSHPGKTDLKAARLVGRATTALSLPLVLRNGSLYAHRLSATGWVPVKLETNLKLASEKVSGSENQSPKATPKASSTYEVKEENALKTLAPRFWVPSYRSVYGINTLGGSMHGFDVTHRHAYSLGVEYTFQMQYTGYDASYSYRGLGPTLKPFYSKKIDNDSTYVSGTSQRFFADEDYGVEAFFPLLGVDFQLTSLLGAGYSKAYLYEKGGHLLRSGRTVPQSYAGILFSNVEGARLPIQIKEGRSMSLIGYTYFPRGREIYRGVFNYREFLALSENTVLSPRLQADFVSHYNRFSNGMIDPELRGYSLVENSARQAVVGSVDYFFPIVNIFRGWDTRPIFFNGVSGSLFGETTTLVDGSSQAGTYPAAGGGLHFNMELFYNLPTSLNIEYSYGFKSQLEGGQRVKVSFTTTGLQW